jgi:hypothetical protein
MEYLHEGNPACEPDKRIDALYVMVAIHANGGEGMMGFVSPALGYVPLLSPKRQVVEDMVKLIGDTVAETKNMPDDKRVLRTELRVFRPVRD